MMQKLGISKAGKARRQDKEGKLVASSRESKNQTPEYPQSTSAAPAHRSCCSCSSAPLQMTPRVSTAAPRLVKMLRLNQRPDFMALYTC